MNPCKSIQLAVFLFIASTIFTSGCQSGFLQRPDLSRLAFWKNDNLRLASRSDDVLPPSRHFSPDGTESSIANNDSEGDLQANVDRIIAEAKRAQADKNEKPNAGLAAADPIRKPYSLDSIDPKINKTKPAESNDFVLSNKIKELQAKTNKAISATENTFNAATETVNSATNTFNGWKNSVQQSGENGLTQAANKLKTQTNNAIAATSDSIKQFTKDSIKQVSSSATESIKNTVSNVSQAMDNSFQPTGDAQIVTNPYSAENKVADTGKATNEFISKYKTAALQPSQPAPTGSVTIKNESFSTNKLTPNIQQSSFDASVKKSGSSLLQPNQPLPAQPAATNYPSTGFSAFAPAKRDDVVEGTHKIPTTLLRGTSNFSPGSTRPLRPQN